jgi:hypothetical protein
MNTEVLFQPERDRQLATRVVRAPDGGRNDVRGRRSSISGRAVRGLVHLG